MNRVRELGVREKVPRSEFPNFRDHGKTVDRPLLHLLENLQRRHGRAFAAESGLRRMLCEDSGYMAGVDTIPQALERLELRGLVAQEWLLAGGLKPDGDQCNKGMRLIVVARNRHQRFAFAARAKTRNRRHGITNRVGTLDEARAKIASTLERSPDPRDRQRRFEDAREDAKRQLAELAATWPEETRGRPPD